MFELYEANPILQFLANNIPDAKFPAGKLAYTDGVHDTVNPEAAGEMLTRHMTGDWGCVCDEDRQTNNEALKLGNRILSAYPIDPSKECLGYGDNTVWIITEADRSVTTILLPEEY